MGWWVSKDPALRSRIVVVLVGMIMLPHMTASLAQGQGFTQHGMDAPFVQGHDGDHASDPAFAFDGSYAGGDSGGGSSSGGSGSGGGGGGGGGVGGGGGGGGVGGP